MLRFNPIPEAISWDITKKCNLKCKHCYSNAGVSFQDELSTEEAKQLIDEISEMGIPELIILGGEPFTRGDLFEIIEYAVNKFIDVAVATNGYYINNETAKKLSKLNLIGIQVSIDSSNEKQHDKFRGINGSFKKSLEALKILANHDCPTVVNTVITKDNIEQLEDIIKLCISLNVRKYRFIKYIPSGRGISNFNQYAISQEQNKKMQKQIEDLKNKYEEYIEVADDKSMAFLKGDNQLFCTAGISTLSIKANGDVVPCSYINENEFVCGNIKKDTLYRIWNGTKIRIFRCAESMVGKCRTCQYLDVCKGGCKAASYGLYGTSDVAEPYCFL